MPYIISTLLFGVIIVGLSGGGGGGGGYNLKFEIVFCEYLSVASSPLEYEVL